METRVEGQRGHPWCLPNLMVVFFLSLVSSSLWWGGKEQWLDVLQEQGVRWSKGYFQYIIA